jgi:hypothetical protein
MEIFISVLEGVFRTKTSQGRECFVENKIIKEAGLMIKLLRVVLLLPLLFWLQQSSAAEGGLRPFIEGTALSASLADATKTVVAALEKGGFEVVGRYSPVKNVTIISITSPLMLKNAAATDRGGYGAALSVALESVSGKTFLTYMNPKYVANGYRLASDNAQVAQALGVILGNEKTFGANPRTVSDLRGYQYSFGMETFNDPMDLGSFKGFQAGIQQITSRLRAGSDGVHLVYQIRIPGKDEVVFGVDLASKNPDANGIKLIDKVDSGIPHRYAFLPYEVVLKDRNAEALNLRFRMALFFPDLPMMGSGGSFFSLRSAPDAIKHVLRKALGGTVMSDSNSTNNGFGSF